jgi:hypothetical protein
MSKEECHGNFDKMINLLQKCIQLSEKDSNFLCEKIIEILI